MAGHNHEARACCSIKSCRNAKSQQRRTVARYVILAAWLQLPPCALLQARVSRLVKLARLSVNYKKVAGIIGYELHEFRIVRRACEHDGPFPRQT